MAIEDAATLAQCMAVPGASPAEAMRSYEGLRRGRTARVQRAAAMTGKIYHQSGPVAVARDAAMRLMGGERLRARYDWLYDWRST
jgi:salicylate hydroxylase